MPTIKDIANKSKVSQAAVSRILNEDTSLSVTEETKMRVLKVAKDLGYVKKHKKNEKDKYVGIVIWHSHAEEAEDNYYQGIRKSIEKRLINEGFKPQLIYRRENSEIEVPQNDLEGIIAIGKFSHGEIEMFFTWSKYVVLVDSCTSLKNVDSVSVDLKELTMEALELFEKEGYDDIGFICGREKIGKNKKEFIDLREEAYMDFMKSRGKDKKDLKFKIGTFGMKSGYELMSELIEKYKNTLPKAFFIASDYLSMGALKALHEAKIPVPKEVKIISVDNLEFASYAKPSLTSIDIPRTNLGLTAVELLVERLKGRNFAKRVFIPYEIVYRESFNPNIK